MATRYTAPSHETSDREEDSTVALLRRLMDELATLFRQEVALATAELTGALTKLTAGVVSMLTGGAVLFAGFLVLLAAATLGLATVVALWLAALIVGAAVSLIGFLMVYAGKKAVDPSTLQPRHSPESLLQDKQVLTRSAS